MLLRHEQIHLERVGTTWVRVLCLGRHGLLLVCRCGPSSMLRPRSESAAIEQKQGRWLWTILYFLMTAQLSLLGWITGYGWLLPFLLNWISLGFGLVFCLKKFKFKRPILSPFPLRSNYFCLASPWIALCICNPIRVNQLTCGSILSQKGCKNFSTIYYYSLKGENKNK